MLKGFTSVLVESGSESDVFFFFLRVCVPLSKVRLTDFGLITGDKWTLYYRFSDNKKERVRLLVMRVLLP